MENNKNHILIVDDDNRIRDLLKDYLSENKYIVSSAENADQAKEKLKYLKFEIRILYHKFVIKLTSFWIQKVMPVIIIHFHFLVEHLLFFY